MSEEEILDIMNNLTLYEYDFSIESKYVEGHDEIAERMGNEAIQGLLDLYNKEKEKNASLKKEIKLMKSININDNYISKDKIKQKIKELEEKSDYWNCDEIEILKELLEE